MRKTIDSTAIEVSIRIMNAFVEMRHFLVNNAALVERISAVELKQLEYQNQTDEKFNKVFAYIDNHAEDNQKIFFDGQIYDAFSLIVSIIQKAQKEVMLRDSICFGHSTISSPQMRSMTSIPLTG